MKTNLRIIIGGVLLTITVMVAALAGYVIGQRGKGLQDSPVAAAADAAAKPSGKKERKLLYYRNPMGLPDTSPVPKKDPMGMDYIPVYEGEDDDAGSANQVRLNTAKVQKLGVKTEKAVLRELDKRVRTTGRVEANERRIVSVSPKFDGYVERLYVNTNGQAVVKGQPLFSVYSPELVSAQREYVVAAQGLQSLQGASENIRAGMRQLTESSMMRLKNWDISTSQLKTLARTGDVRRNMVFHSPVSGVVTEKKAMQGMRFMPGEMLFQITDLSSVWVMADVFEQDMRLLTVGTTAQIRFDAYPDQVFEGKVDYIYPTLKADTRSVQVRIELPNPKLQLKPDMYAHVDLPVAGKGKVLVIPRSAVIDSGTRQVAFVQVKEGRYEPRDIKLGARSDESVEVLDGVKEGEDVVVTANFLIDAESNLKAALGNFNTDKENAPAAVGHKAEGTVEELDTKAGSLFIHHQPIASLKWPEMTMEFKVANPSLLNGIKEGAAIHFEFVERNPGEWVVTSIQPGSVKTGKAAAQANAHAGH